MSIILLPSQRTLKPPFGVQINFGHPLAVGLVGCYLFNEGGGSSVRDLLGWNVGVMTNSPTWVIRSVGMAMNFLAASQQYIAVGNPPSINFDNSVSYSIEFKVRSLDAAPNFQQIVNKDSLSGDQRIHFFISSSRLWRWDSFDSTIDINNTKGWQHILYTYLSAGSNTGTERFYLDGKQTATRTGAMPAWRSSDVWRFCQAQAANWAFNGDVEFIRIYNRALTAAEAMWLFMQPYAMMTPRRIPAFVPAAGGGSAARHGDFFFSGF